MMPANYTPEAIDDETAQKQVQQFNKSLKEEKMVERLEKLINSSALFLEPETKIYDCLEKREYFDLLCTMISRPHQYQSVTSVSIPISQIVDV